MQGEQNLPRFSISPSIVKSLCAQQVSKVMGSTVQSMSTAMKGMEVDQIAKTMSEFERQFENMDVTSGTYAFRDRCDSHPTVT
jgi:Snf7